MHMIIIIQIRRLLFMSILNLFKKQDHADHSNSYSQLSAGQALIGTFDQAAEYEGFKKIGFSCEPYPEAIDSLKKLANEKPAIKAGENKNRSILDLDGCRISVCQSRTYDRIPVILLYIDNMFVGAKIAGSERSRAVYDALKDHAVTALHVEILHDASPDSDTPFEIRLIMNGLE